MTVPMCARILLLAFCIFLLPRSGEGQKRYFTKSGFISFSSKAPLEDIEANNRQVVSFLDIGTGELVFSVPVKGFNFKNALMQEHFNENYLESDKYPKASFKGKILNIVNVNLNQDKLYKVLVEGVLTIHGVDRLLKTDATLEVKNKQLTGACKFYITPQEFNIEIPFLVKEHIAKRIEIAVNLSYLPYQAKSL